MAEIVGLVLGVAGLAPVFGKCYSGLRKLRKIRQVSAEFGSHFDSLLQELQILEGYMLHAHNSSHPSDALHKKQFQANLKKLADSIADLAEQIPSDFDSKRSKLKGSWDLRHLTKDVEALRYNVQSIKQDMTLFFSMQISRKLLQSEPIEGSIAPLSQIQAALEYEDAMDASSLEKKPCGSAQRRRSSWNCLDRTCYCSCHQTASISSRFWALEFSPLNAWNSQCDQPFCTGPSYGIRLALSFSNFGIPWSSIMSLQVATALGKVHIRPSLELQRTVKYTSPGFAVIWGLERDLITFEEACNELRKLAREDPSFRTHVNPSGESYIEVLMKAQWIYLSDNRQYDLLKFLVRELQVIRGFEDKQFLQKNNYWFVDGHQVEFLDVIVKNGFDPTVFDIPRLHPTIQCWQMNPDPFFIRYLSILCRNNPGVEGIGPLDEAVLSGSDDSVLSWSTRCAKNERNFLGQTPLHLAVSQPQYIKILLDQGHDTNVLDRHGHTPLMYAAVYDEIETAKMLIDAGADPTIMTKYNEQTFLDFAAACGNWELLYISLVHINGLGDAVLTQRVGRLGTSAYTCWQRLEDRGEKLKISIADMISVCPAEASSLFDDPRGAKHNTWLFYARSGTDVDFLLQHCSLDPNFVNSYGQHALLSALERDCRSEVVQRLLHGGTDIRLQDTQGCTVFHYIMESANINDNFLDTLSSLIVGGADVLCPDYCDCFCSARGCPPGNMLPGGPYDLLAVLEWVLSVFESRGAEAAKDTVISIIRRTLHEALDMTHTCCRGTKRGRNQSLPKDDIHEILDEESEFCDVLEQEMARISNNEFSTLFVHYLRRVHFDACQDHEEAMAISPTQPVQGHGMGWISEQGIDSRKDKFVYFLGPIDRDPPEFEITQYIAEYIRCLENQLERFRSSEISSETERYLRRLSWVRFICHLFCITKAAIVENMRTEFFQDDDDADSRGRSHRTIKRFSELWEMCEDDDSKSVRTGDGFAGRELFT